MRFLVLTMLLVGVLATTNVNQALHVRRRSREKVANFLGGAHFGWGLAMDDTEGEEVKEVSNKKFTKMEPECEIHHRHWHLPGIEHCSDVEEAYDDIIPDGTVKEVSNKKNLKKKETKAECEERHRRLHLPGIEHCSDIDEAFDGLE